MAKVIGLDSTFLRQCSCKKCASIIEYSLNELRQYTYKDISQCVEVVYWIPCPSCGNKIEGVRHY